MAKPPSLSRKETLEDLELTVEGLERVGGDSAGGHVAAIAELTKALTIVENISSVTNAMMVRTTAMSTNQTAFLTYIYNHHLHVLHRLLLLLHQATP